MGRRLEYEVKTSVRLNMSNPQHVKINDVIQNLDPKIFKSKNQFIIDAIQFYIDNYGKETFVIKKKEKERAEYIRSEDIDDIKEEVIEAATNEARKEVIRLLGGVISGMNVGQPVIMQAANSEAQEPTEDDIMREMFARDGMPQEIADMMIAEIPPEQTMWVISNEKGINGAASMLYENELHELAESLESDLYILPSSVHEVIAVSSDMGSPEMLAQMVVEVNMQEVSLDERLSNQVYHYDKDLRKLTLATDTPNKRLDGIVAEPPLVYDAKKSIA